MGVTKTDEAVEAIKQKLIDDAKMEMSVYIVRAMLRFTADDKNYVMALHHVLDHFICFMMYPASSRIYVFDSVDYDISFYQEFIDIIQWVQILRKPRRETQERMRQDGSSYTIPVLQATQAICFMRYNCSEFLRCTNRYVSKPEDYNHSDLVGDSRARSSPEIVTDVMRDMCQFIHGISATRKETSSTLNKN
ncbi:hypothetical protein ACP70R_045694 [Stipagrostis hirtigluma subsp. patula]